MALGEGFVGERYKRVNSSALELQVGFLVSVLKNVIDTQIQCHANTNPMRKSEVHSLIMKYMNV